MADPSAMTVAQLRAELKNRGLDTTGLKADLTARLQAARRSAGNSGMPSGAKRSALADGSLKRKRDPTTAAVVPTTVRYLQRGAISILDAVAEEIPDVFTEHILPNLDLNDTLNLAQVNKAYNAAVWSVDGVRSLEKKIKAHIKYLTDMGNKEGEDSYDGETFTAPMFWAVRHGNLPAVRALIETEIGVVDVKEWWALHHAASNRNNPKVVKALIEAGANVNVQDWDGETALGMAITPTFDHSEPHTAITALAPVPNIIELIKAGADVNLANNLGDTPLHVAVHNAQETCVALLIQAGADVHKVDHNGDSPMELAVRRLASWKERVEEVMSRKKQNKSFREFLILCESYDYQDGMATRVSMHENIVHLLRYAGAK